MLYFIVFCIPRWLLWNHRTDVEAWLAIWWSCSPGFTSFWNLLFLIRNNEDMSKALIAREYGRNRIRLAAHLAQNLTSGWCSATTDFIIFVDDSRVSILTITYSQRNKEAFKNCKLQMAVALPDESNPGIMECGWIQCGLLPLAIGYSQPSLGTVNWTPSEKSMQQYPLVWGEGRPC